MKKVYSEYWRVLRLNLIGIIATPLFGVATSVLATLAVIFAHFKWLGTAYKIFWRDPKYQPGKELILGSNLKPAEIADVRKNFQYLPKIEYSFDKASSYYFSEETVLAMIKAAKKNKNKKVKNVQVRKVQKTV